MPGDCPAQRRILGEYAKGDWWTGGNRTRQQSVEVTSPPQAAQESRHKISTGSGKKNHGCARLRMRKLKLVFTTEREGRGEDEAERESDTDSAEKQKRPHAGLQGAGLGQTF